MTLIPTLETSRLRLRAPERRDFDACAAMWADERVTRYISGAARPRDESWRRFIGVHGLWAMMGYGYWVFAERESDRYIGMGGLSFFERGVAALEDYPEAGWAIAPDWWGKGIASEAMGAALTWADDVLHAPEVRCIINPGHGASEAVAAKLGFRVIGEADMQPDPVNVYARLRQETRGG
jgi:RimJ/RimL family protein N-acetyltransferase